MPAGFRINYHNSYIIIIGVRYSRIMKPIWCKTNIFCNTKDYKQSVVVVVVTQDTVIEYGTQLKTHSTCNVTNIKCYTWRECF